MDHDALQKDFDPVQQPRAEDLTPGLQQSFEAALREHRAGHLAEAEAIYRQILTGTPDHSGTLHMLGVLAGQSGRDDAGIEMITRAIAAKPGIAAFHLNLAEIYRRTGRHDLGARSYAQAVRIRPQSAIAHYCLGLELRELGRLEEAVASYEQAIRLDPGFADAHAHLAIAAMQLGRIEQAIEAQQAVVRLRPDQADVWCNLSSALAEAGRSAEAIAAGRRAISLCPANAGAHSNLAAALGAEGQYEKALTECREALRLQPGLAQAHNILGSTLMAIGRAEEASVSLERAIGLRPDYAEAHSNLGIALHNRGESDQAISVYRTAIALDPNLPNAHFNLALALLGKGDFLEGWEEYEWRWRCKDFNGPRRDLDRPQWDGSPLPGRTVLLHAEQGFGDTLQFIRYLPLVARRGGSIIVECQPELEPLLRTISEGCQVVAQGQPLPAFDVHCRLLSLPRIFGTKLGTIPNRVPYLCVDRQRQEKWRRRLAADSTARLDCARHGRLDCARHGRRLPLVGLVWAGRATPDPQRTCGLAALTPLAAVAGVRFVSLQTGPAGAEAHDAPRGMALADLSAELRDFADTAALMANLDLVITIDTAAAHLAGALGRPTWTLLKDAADWRWLADRADNPWYPTMRLFRQPRRGDWASVAQRVARELGSFAEPQQRTGGGRLP